MALDRSGRVTLVEVKSCRADFVADRKWQSYLDYCDRFYFAVAAGFPLDLLPPEEGLILADRFAGEILREAPLRSLSAGAAQGDADPLRPGLRRPPAGAARSAVLAAWPDRRPRTASPRSGGGRSSSRFGSLTGQRSRSSSWARPYQPASTSSSGSIRSVSSAAVARKPSISEAGNGQGCEERYWTSATSMPASS